MKQIEINGGNARYLSELKEFKDGLPFGILNKTKTDVGGTYCAINCKDNYIVVCPFIDLVDSIGADKNNKYEVFKCYGGVREHEFKKYIKENETHKIAVTYNSLPKLMSWLTNFDYKILVDEYHMILEDMDYRYDAIDGLMNNISSFKHYTFLSATPMNTEFEIKFFKDLPHYKVIWDNIYKKQPIRIKTANIYKGVVKLIETFDNGLHINDVNGNITEVEELYIFINSVKGIKYIVDCLELDPEDVKICCADRQRNRLQLGDYKVEAVSSPNKRVNFFTKKCFQGCNLFTNNGLIIIASDAYREHTLVDISTSMEQISGRLRENNEYSNIFRNTLVHLFSTSKRLMTDEEFAVFMANKEQRAKDFIDGQYKLNNEQKMTYLPSLDLESEIVSLYDGELVYNDLKRQSLIYKQELKKSYKDGISVREKFNESEKFDATNQLYMAVTVSYKQLLKNYLDKPSDIYESENPEFKLIKQYLKESEINTLGWNKEKLIKAVEDKMSLNTVFKNIYPEISKNEFISNSDLKIIIKKEFDKLGIKLTAKASLLKECILYEVSTGSIKDKNKKTVNGYFIGKFIV